jgi:EAL domain-containing protein (putative c-di-GMP-specific phosphodiesterase class I)
LRDRIDLPFEFSMAFQPIVNIATRQVRAYEALARGMKGEPAWSVLSQVTEENRYAFDQSCRIKAITLASDLGLADTGAGLSINLVPGAVYSPAAGIQLTLRTASNKGFPVEKLIFEITESEETGGLPHLREIVEDYRRRGIKIALDDLGAGYAGLNMLADFPADIVKLDMALTRNLDRRPRALAIVRSMVGLTAQLNTELVAEGIETEAEYDALRDCGISLMQGYLFARPAFEALPQINWVKSSSRV